MPTISVAALPDYLEPGSLTGKIAVVIDVLRATTTIARALEQGARCVLPVASLDAARIIAHERVGSLLCGERGGMKPEGFVLGNSPSEYTHHRVNATDIVLTTTNGTRALHMCSHAHEVVTASITTLDAVCAYLKDADRDAVLVCSGTDRKISLEDCICAGMIVSRLAQSHAPDDAARLISYASDGDITMSHHAQCLFDLGFAGDVQYASKSSICPLVPCFDPLSGEITPIA